MTRTTTTQVTFANPFRLRGLDAALPAGTYEVETDEERIEGPSSLAYRRVQAIIHLRGNPGQPSSDRSLTVEPADLDAAIARDAAMSPAPVEHLARAMHAGPTATNGRTAERRDLDRAANEGMIYGPHLPAAASGSFAAETPAPDEAAIAAYGITRVPADRFHYRDWRYTSLDDAVAQAKRDAAGR